MVDIHGEIAKLEAEFAPGRAGQEAMLGDRVKAALRAVAIQIPFEIGPWQKVALGSFILDRGVDTFARSTLKKYLLRGKSKELISDAFLAHCYVTKDGIISVDQGLRARRKVELALYLSQEAKDGL